jgi:hypothetical protein
MDRGSVVWEGVLNSHLNDIAPIGDDWRAWILLVEDRDLTRCTVEG